MYILGIAALSAVLSGGTRIVLLLLLLLAVILILAGSAIALLTLYKQRKPYVSRIDSTRIENERT